MRRPVGPWIPGEVRADPERLESWLSEAHGMSEAQAAKCRGPLPREHYQRMEVARQVRRGGAHVASAEEIARRVAARRYWIARGKELEK